MRATPSSIPFHQPCWDDDPAVNESLPGVPSHPGDPPSAEPGDEPERAGRSGSPPVRTRSAPRWEVALIALTASVAVGCNRSQTAEQPVVVASAVAPANVGGARSASTYTCPMHPEVVSSKPDRCPKCGMDLVPVDEKKGQAPSVGKHP
jgi:hypothetical protein